MYCAREVPDHSLTHPKDDSATNVEWPTIRPEEGRGGEELLPHTQNTSDKNDRPVAEGEKYSIYRSESEEQRSCEGVLFA